MTGHQTGPLKVKAHQPVCTASVDIFDLPTALQAPLREVGMRNERHCHDYRDGDYFYLLDFGMLRDATPDSVLHQVVEEERDESLDPDFYPQMDLVKASGYSLQEYVSVLLVLRNVATRVPAEVIAENKLAISIWH